MVGVGAGTGLVAGVGTYLVMNGMKNQPESGVTESDVWRYTLGVGAGVGALSALVMYLTCLGVSYGMPVSKAKGRKKNK
jgi:hypothetical protein